MLVDARAALIPPRAPIVGPWVCVIECLMFTLPKDVLRLILGAHVHWFWRPVGFLVCKRFYHLWSDKERESILGERLFRIVYLRELIQARQRRNVPMPAPAPFNIGHNAAVANDPVETWVDGPHVNENDTGYMIGGNVSASLILPGHFDREKATQVTLPDGIPFVGAQLIMSNPEYEREMAAKVSRSPIEHLLLTDPELEKIDMVRCVKCLRFNGPTQGGEGYPRVDCWCSVGFDVNFMPQILQAYPNFPPSHGYSDDLFNMGIQCRTSAITYKCPLTIDKIEDGCKSSYYRWEMTAIRQHLSDCGQGIITCPGCEEGRPLLEHWLTSHSQRTCWATPNEKCPQCSTVTLKDVNWVLRDMQKHIMACYKQQAVALVEPCPYCKREYPAGSVHAAHVQSCGRYKATCLKCKGIFMRKDHNFQACDKE